MHELSLVRSLIRQVETIVANDGGGTPSEVHVSMGPLSGVEPMLVSSAFDQLAPSSRLAGAKLKIDYTPLQAICTQCGESFVVESFCFRCSQCQSPNVRITGGDEFRLLSVSIEEDHTDCLKKVSAK